ncbi:MAG: hypothetical protein K0M64_01880 [Rhizobium sp.]|nr:hypothetical protein [Rhizobium sp.]
MPIFEVTDTALNALARAPLSSVNLHERRDLQRLLRDRLSEIVPDVLVIAEEFGDWDESRRRIDLLGVGRDGRLVVMELKRGDTGAHMELQAIRYAAMVSTMTFDQAVETFSRNVHLAGADAARQTLLDHLQWMEPNEDAFAQDVRVVLFSEDFSRELTASVLWLNDRGLDITCYRMGGYTLAGRVLLDFQQIIPLSEAEEFQIQVRHKQLAERSTRAAGAQVPWNGELYANYGGSRSWADARKYGFISAGGGDWFTRTLTLLETGRRVWVNRPGLGYVGVGIIEGPPTPARDFMVDTPQGPQRYVDVGNPPPELLANLDDPGKSEQFVKVRWLATVAEDKAMRQPGFFGNQNSAAKPRAANWIATVAALQTAFNLEG